MNQADIKAPLIYKCHLIGSLEAPELEKSLTSLDLYWVKNHFGPDELMEYVLVGNTGFIGVYIVPGGNGSAGLPVLLIPETPLENPLDAWMAEEQLNGLAFCH